MSGHKTRAWVPLTRGTPNPEGLPLWRADYPPPEYAIEAWGNDLYQLTCVRQVETGDAYLSIKRNDRHAIRDWRHLQQIKNEVCGDEAEAVELFPAESRMVDEANQYHLWVMAPGKRWEIGFATRRVQSPEETKQMSGGKARQRAWQPGLTTGT